MFIRDVLPIARDPLLIMRGESLSHPFRVVT